MPSFASLKDPKVFHILTYGTLLGSNLFQTFMAGPLAYQALPRPQFSTLQQAIFPPYFTLQTVLPLFLILTWPGEKLASAGGAVARKGAGYAGVFEEENRWIALIPIALMCGTSLLNLVALGPATTKVMKERKHQETRDGKKYYDAGPKSEEMQRLNSSFAKLHGAASLANLIGLGAMFVYGATLAEMM
ncbi:uncharacterized protein RCC_11472 [Ramularia collo-cygni]|uniref:TMEM205-like domain-containing protein n=1 Tax=Ramularia collo-cygni TaxID=112498 RepID=A0A2D3VSU0_9PEZI|nr:uncharacterized protein RCC_11472 [Ramularia collo-cygni]CZT25803.1 uncharacterized protein RCC_11472 [Ramularia collo-cygni]